MNEEDLLVFIERLKECRSEKKDATIPLPSLKLLIQVLYDYRSLRYPQDDNIIDFNSEV
jgi:hypothetical protein